MIFSEWFQNHFSHDAKLTSKEKNKLICRYRVSLTIFTLFYYFATWNQRTRLIGNRRACKSR